MFKFCPYCGYEVDKQEKDGFQCFNCKKWTYYSSSPAVSILVKVKNESLLVIRGIDPGKGEDDIVGGFLEYSEEPIAGAIREFKEEVGITLDPSKLEFFGNWIGEYFYQGKNQFVLNIIYLIELDEKFEGNPASDVESLHWINISKTPKFAFSYLQDVWKKLQKKYSN